MATTKGRRAANRMGSITQRHDGRWEGKVSFTKPNGTAGRKTVYGKTQGECRDKVLALLADLQQGRPIITKDQSLEDYLSDWLEVSIKPRRSPATYSNYKQMIGLYILPVLGEVKLAKLTGQQIERWENDLRQHRVVRTGALLSARTVQLCHGILRGALNRAVKLRLIASNPVLTVDAPAARRPQVRPLELAEARALLTAVRGSRLEALWSVAIACGVRPGEALGLRWADVSLDRGIIYVRQQLQRDLDGKLTLQDLKTERARRVIHLPAVTIEVLHQHRARQFEERLRAHSWEDNDLIFCTEGRRAGTIGGRPLIHRNVYKLLQRTLKAAGLPHQRMYDLRHLCASLLLAQGASMREIMEILGHSQMSMTSDTYTHVYNEQGKLNAERMNSLLSS